MVAPQATTPAIIRADFITTIKAIAPSHPQHRDKPWRYCENPQDVASGLRIRKFHLLCMPGERDPEGFFGEGETWMFRMNVITSYGDLDAEADDSIVTRDAVDLSHAFIRRQEPVLPGLEYVRYLGFESEVQQTDEIDAVGQLVGFHLFEVHYHEAALGF